MIQHLLSRAALSTLLLSSLSLAACKAGGGLQLGSSSSSSDGSSESSYGGPSGLSGSDGGAAADRGPAEPRWDDFAFAVRERTGTYYGPWTITKLTTFKVGKACWEKMSDAKADSVNTASYYIRNVHELAKLWTHEDWDRVENQRGDRARDRKLVEPMLDKFAEQFHMTIAIEGEDCEVGSDALWLRYWFDISEAFADYPPAAGKLFITLNVTSTREVSVDVDETGSRFTITAPRDIAAPEYSEKLEKPFRRVARKL